MIERMALTSTIIMPESSATYLVGVVMGLIYLTSLWLRSSTYQLKHIPTVGPSGVISSYLGAIKYIKHGRDMIQEGYDKYYGRAFKIPTMSGWVVVVSGTDMIEDLKRASDDQLSFKEAASETLQTDYTLCSESRDHYHVAVIRTLLTRNLAIRFSDVMDEITTAFSEIIPIAEEWVTFPSFKSIIKIVCRSSNRLFVGLPLCRNPDYRELNEQFTIDVFLGAEIIKMFPPLLRPIVGRYFGKMPSNISRALSHTREMLQEQLDKDDQFGKDWPDRPNNLISWLLNEAQGSQRSVRDLTIRILFINFAAIHTTTMALTQVLHDLACHPEYVAPLREEVDAVIEAGGWTKVSMGKMRKLDSFIKESQRLSTGTLSIFRKVIKDFTFSNGTTLPAGTFVAVSTRSTHIDDNIHANGHEFNGFRFSDKREVHGEETKHQTVTLSNDYMVFGAGRHACPGRFFAVNELKAMMAHILFTYDMTMAKEGPRPPFTAELMFRKRRI